MKCKQSHPGFELVSLCPFPTRITITPLHHGHLLKLCNIRIITGWLVVWLVGWLVFTVYQLLLDILCWRQFKNYRIQLFTIQKWIFTIILNRLAQHIKVFHSIYHSLFSSIYPSILIYSIVSLYLTQPVPIYVSIYCNINVLTTNVLMKFRFLLNIISNRSVGWLVGWLVGFYGISTFVGYLMPNPFLDK